MSQILKPNRLADLLFDRAVKLLTPSCCGSVYIKRNLKLSWDVYLGANEEDIFCEPLILSREQYTDKDSIKAEVYRVVEVLTERIKLDDN